MTKSIVVIEDDSDVIDVLLYFLQKENFSVRVAQDGLSGLELASRVTPDLILLDLVLPKMNGIEVCRRLRAIEWLRETRVIMLSAKSTETDKLEGFETGADDYVTKPFSPYELIARIKASLRLRDGSAMEKQLEYDRVIIDRAKHEVSYNGEKIEMTAKELAVLIYLIENKGRVLTRDMILKRIWGHDYFGTTRTVDVHVAHLRQKISILSDAIVTIKPIGYKLQAN
jgi:DNA-binding response OmpR family regulator